MNVSIVRINTSVPNLIVKRQFSRFNIANERLICNCTCNYTVLFDVSLLLLSYDFFFNFNKIVTFFFYVLIGVSFGPFNISFSL